MRIPICLTALLILVGTALAGEEAPPAQASEAPVPPAAAAVVATPAPAPVAATGAVATPASSDKNERPTSVTASPATGDAGQLDYRSLDPLLRHEEYQYRSGGRDPFAPLVTAREAGEGEEVEITDPGVADLIMVGRAWGGGRVLALAETPQGMGLLLRVGDRVRDGQVLAISPEGVTFSQTTYGLVRQVTLPFGSGEEGRDER